MAKITRFTISEKQRALTVEFADTTTYSNQPEANAQLSFEYLRISSPSNATNKQQSAQVISHKKAVQLTNIESVAKHGYRFSFDDGHSAIYSDSFVHTLLIENEERWQNYLNSLKASGHSREATIEIKQL